MSQPGHVFVFNGSDHLLSYDLLEIHGDLFYKDEISHSFPPRSFREHPLLFNVSKTLEAKWAPFVNGCHGWFFGVQILRSACSVVGQKW